VVFLRRWPQTHAESVGRHSVERASPTPHAPHFLYEAIPVADFRRFLPVTSDWSRLLLSVFDPRFLAFLFANREMSPCGTSFAYPFIAETLARQGDTRRV
jgi:hypothetical protein